MASKRKAEGPLGAPNKAYRQGKLFSFFCKQAQRNKETKTTSATPTLQSTPADQSKCPKDSEPPNVPSVATKLKNSVLPTEEPKHASLSLDPTTNETSVTNVKVGDRIEIYWPNDDDYYAAKVSKVSGSAAASARCYIVYDDGQEEWIDLATATFRFVRNSSSRATRNIRKRSRILDDDDDEGEMEFVMPESDEDGSVYNQDEHQEEDDEDDGWLVSDDEDDTEVVISKTKKKLKVSAHKTPSRTVEPSDYAGRGFSSLTHRTTKLSATPPPRVTPKPTTSSNKKSTPSLPVSSVSSYQSPTMTQSQPVLNPSYSIQTSNGAPPMYQRDVVNPAGSHAHHHMKFLMAAHRRDARGRTMSDPEYDPRTLWVDRVELEKHCGKLTDGVQQWWDLKAQYFDTVLLFKTGKFYEMFHMDADVGVQVCGHCYMKGHIAHSGFPEAAYGKFADMMVRAGYKVCRVEQTETPEQLKERKKNHRGKGAPKVVNREVCSILTAGTRTFCVLDRMDDMADDSSSSVGPLLAIREVLLETNDSEANNDEVQPVCEYGVTVVDAVRGVITIGQFADDILRSRMDTLLLTFQPSEVLLQGGQEGASPALRAMVQSMQQRALGPFRIEYIQSKEIFPKSNATDPNIRSQLERHGDVLPWDVQETLGEIHRRGYYPRASKKDEGHLSVSRWPEILRAVVEGNAELAISSFGAALFYLQRNLIDMELLSMGIVKAYIPPVSSVAQEKNQAAVDTLAAQDTSQNEPQNPESSDQQHQSSSSTSMRKDVSNEEEMTANMALDGTTLVNLEILTNNADHKPNGSLWSLINHTKSPHGKRLLRAWLLRPLFRKTDIQRRTDAVDELARGDASAALAEATTLLSKCGDIERLLSRIHSMGVVPADDTAASDVKNVIHPSERAVLYETATYTRRMVSDFSALLNGLRHANCIPEVFARTEIKSGLLRKIVHREEQGGRFPDMTDSLDWFFENFDCDKARQGQFEPARGIDTEYDDACDAIERILQDLEHYKNEMCTHHLKPASLARATWKYINIKPDSRDKFLIELPSNIVVPNDFIVKGKRGSGTKQVNKYRSVAIDSLVQELDYAYEKQKQRRSLGMRLIFSKFDSMRHLWAAAGQATALLDALASLAKASTSPGYSRAKILDCPPGSTSCISVVQGRHPIVEKTLKSGEFVPNDIELGSNGKRILLLSGVNMGGKSTCLRQTCLLAIMAQIGCFVPAESFTLTPVDRIYTRLGASDRILMGQSTFFVELAENAAALRGASRRSLVIMDELGRGTSTFDGTAIASATVKHLVDRTKCISLFATHYHTLLDEWRNHPSVLLGHMECHVGTGSVAAHEQASDESTITFLYTLGAGIFPKSFGINVARLAGLPPQVISNAARISAEFEQQMKDGSNPNALTGTKAQMLKRLYQEAKESDDWENKLLQLMQHLNSK